ncbi:hypothetical protein [Streptomyces sp. CA-251251]|uniref:hypothetical protein n=1 Tax=Streptomyces sp. CA-251251 TaxID=3240063 RepID=UPI003D90B770
MENTMHEMSAPEGIEYSDALTPDDVGPLRVFLAARLTELLGRSTSDSDEHFAIRTLVDLAASDGQHLTNLLEHRRANSSHEKDVTLDQNVRLWWNRLTHLAVRWQTHPEFRSEWRELRYCNDCHMRYGTTNTRKRSVLSFNL